MTDTPWYQQRMAALDFEASDKLVESARIVSCALILVGGGLPTEPFEWLINPGIVQEPGAVKVHGLTDGYLAEHGQPAAEGIPQIAAAVSKVVQDGIPLVGHNLGSFDLNLLDVECGRHGLGSLVEVCGQPVSRVLDTMVMDKHCAPYRKRVSETQGPYQMRTTAEVYGLNWDEGKAHGARYDAMKSAQAAWKMGTIAAMPAAGRPDWVQALRNSRGPYERFDDLRVDIDELHRRQAGWAAASAASYQEWLRSPKAGEKYNAEAVIDGSWPLRGAS
jgi:DNA polymerase-3 subunit epsilon